MDGIPLHTARLVEKLLGSYCERVCPPSARHAVELRFELGLTRITLSEVRRFCGIPSAQYCVALAQFRYLPRSGEWRLYHAAAAIGPQRPPGWRRYPRLHRSRSFLTLLRELDADPAGCFWSRLNGRSLRWCSSRGRCAGCDDRYGRILGLASRPAAPVVPLPLTRLRAARPTLVGGRP